MPALNFRSYFIGQAAPRSVRQPRRTAPEMNTFERANVCGIFHYFAAFPPRLGSRRALGTVARFIAYLIFFRKALNKRQPGERETSERKKYAVNGENEKVASKTKGMRSRGRKIEMPTDERGEDGNFRVNQIILLSHLISSFVCKFTIKFT